MESATAEDKYGDGAQDSTYKEDFDGYDLQSFMEWAVEPQHDSEVLYPVWPGGEPMPARCKDLVKRIVEWLGEFESQSRLGRECVMGAIQDCRSLAERLTRDEGSPADGFYLGHLHEELYMIYRMDQGGIKVCWPGRQLRSGCTELLLMRAIDVCR